MFLLGLCLLLVIVAEIAVSMIPSAPARPSIPTEPSLPVPTVPAAPRPQPKFVVTAPAVPREEVINSTFLIRGTADPESPVYINDFPVAPASDGSFSFPLPLHPGENRVMICHKEQYYAYEIQYNYILLTQVTPSEDTSFPSGGTLPVTAVARKGSAVSATFRGKTIPLTPGRTVGQTADDAADALIEYSGSFPLPSGNVVDLPLGAVSFTAELDGVSQTAQSGKILCKHTKAVKYSDPSVTPVGDEYVDVGSGYIAEISYFTAETFAIGNSKDLSSPLYNYLPEGTVDYCYPEVYTDSGTGNQFLKLRCGRKIFLQRHDTPDKGDFYIANCYIGTLPDHNEIKVASVVNQGQHTVITLDTLWKAPFFFTLAPQKYTSPYYRDWTVSSVTATYIDIKFCYATVFEGSIDLGDNPLFSRGEIIRGKADTTLRLHLRKIGGFYGWDATYNSKGQLCFTFLNPPCAAAADNAYGIDLSGITIALDVGHGGHDCGSKGVDKKVTEAERNLYLANLLRQELESMGATVVMNRTGDTLISADTRIRWLKELAPDLCIALHHNGSSASYVHGCGTYHYNAYSSPAAKAIHNQLSRSGIYRKTNLDWHYYYLARQSACPVVLIENGYITNPEDFAAITDHDANVQKAQAIARGVADYFRSNA